MIERGDMSVGIVYVGNNLEYTGTIVRGFKEGLAGSGVKIVYEKIFYDRAEFPSIVKDMADVEPDAILISCNGRDGAEIFQQYARIKELPHLYSDQWSMLTDILSFAGRTTEGLILINNFSYDQNDMANDEFRRKYIDKYSINPNYAAVLAYEAVMVFYYGVEKAGFQLSAEKIKHEIITKKYFQGVYQEFSIDTFGDAFRDKSLIIVKDSEYTGYE